MGFTLPRLQKVCFCCHVRMGALVIGYLSMLMMIRKLGVVIWIGVYHSLFSSLMYIASTITAIVFVAKYVEEESKRPNPQHTPQELAAGALRIYITCGIYLVLYLYYFVISLLVVIGVHQNKARLLTYYVKTVLFLLILTVALVVVTVVFMGVFAALPLLLSSVIVFYCLLVVRSAYLDMEEANRPKVYEMNVIQTQQAPLMA